MVEQVAEDEEALDFVGAFVDVQDAGVAAMLFQFVHLGTTFDAHDLFGSTDGAMEGFAGVIFADGGLGADGFRAVMIGAANEFIGKRLGGV